MCVSVGFCLHLHERVLSAVQLCMGFACGCYAGDGLHYITFFFEQI